MLKDKIQHNQDEEILKREFGDLKRVGALFAVKEDGNEIGIYIEDGIGLFSLAMSFNRFWMKDLRQVLEDL